jgi:hypothetical protein
MLTKTPVPGVPDQTDSLASLTADFTRMGFTLSEGIQLVACGHTLGGVAGATRPRLVPSNNTIVGANLAGSQPGIQSFDTTPAGFDDSVITQYLDGTTQNPLVVSPFTAGHSDQRLFDADDNKTVSAMVGKSSYDNTCATILAKMLDTVPSDVSLTDAITPYVVKPANLQLNVASDNSKLTFSGSIRLLTTQISKSSISSISIVYKDRTGVDGGSIDASSALGDAAGFDDSFTVRLHATYIQSSLIRW